MYNARIEDIKFTENTAIKLIDDKLYWISRRNNEDLLDFSKTLKDEDIICFSYYKESICYHINLISTVNGIPTNYYK